MPEKKSPTSIIIYSYPQFLYAWPMIAFGVLLAGLQSGGVISESAAAWTYIVIVSLVVLTMGFDLSRNASIFCLVLFGGSWLGILWLQDAKNVMFFAKLSEFISSLKPTISTPALLLISGIFGIVYLVMFFFAFVNDRWRITNNEIEHRTFGHKEDATGRGAKRVVATYPDVLELLICLSGTIAVYSATGNKQLLSIKNIPFLPLRMKKISRILEYSAVNDYNAMIEDDGEQEEETQV